MSRATLPAKVGFRPVFSFAFLVALFLLASPNSLLAQMNEEDQALRAQVLQAIQQGQKSLIDSQNADGTWPNRMYVTYDVGFNSLATLSLLNSGLPADHPAVVRGINWLKRPETNPVKTYDLSMAIMALVASKDPGVRGKIAMLAQRLESYQYTEGVGAGAWDYEGSGHGDWDNSNTQFAVLGLREAVEAGYQVDREVWVRTQQHFMSGQMGGVANPAGAGWGYKPGASTTGSMTVAGIASLSITRSMLAGDEALTPNGQLDCCQDTARPVDLAIESGVRWLSNQFLVRSNPGSGGWPLYYLYGLERAGRFTGQRFFGDHDWYREGAQFLVSTQNLRSGTWRSGSEDEIAGTSLALLFLSKGLSPVLVNKLKYGPRNPQNGEVIGRDWNRHTRDAMNLTDYTASLKGWPDLLSWQVVDLKTAVSGEGVADLLQSPVQYLSGSERLDTIDGQELALLRDYLIQGGFVFAVQNCDSQEFDTGIRDLVRRLFDGQYELRKLPPTHDVYRSENVFPPDGDVPELWGVDFGCRTAFIYAPFDHACRWDKWVKQVPVGRPVNLQTQIDRSLRIGVNVIAYATGRELQDKLQRPQQLAPSDLQRMGRGRLTIGRLRHTGGWDTAPNALRRLQSALEVANVEVNSDTPTIAATDPNLLSFPLLYMHGRRNFLISEDEKTSLKTYLENGGFLFADACCGSTQFDASFRQMIEETMGQKLERIPIDHELYQQELGYTIGNVKRRMPSDLPGASSLNFQESVGEPILEGIKVGKKYVVIYSKYDLSCALERQSSASCAGYPTEDAVRIAVNMVLYGLLQ